MRSNMSPQFRQAISHNLERLNALNINISKSATLYTTYPKDYSKHNYLRNQKTPGVLKQLFLRKAF
jgi:hypothetical protein